MYPSSSSNFPNYSYYPDPVVPNDIQMENMIPFHQNPDQNAQYQYQYQNQNLNQNYENLNGNMMGNYPPYPNGLQEPVFQESNYFQNFSSGNMEFPQYFENQQNFDPLFPTPPLEGFDHFAAETPTPGPVKEKKKRVKKASTMHANTSCSNCGTRDTKLWRRNENGMPECNPCNLYERVNGQKRPESLWNKKTMMRRRRPMAPIQKQ